MPRKKAAEQKHKGVYQNPAGSGIWWCRFVDMDGKRKKRCCGSFADACNFYNEQKARIRKGVIAPVPTHRGYRVTQLIDAALEFSKENHKDQRNFKQRLEVIRKEFGHRIADTVTPADLREWLSDMFEEWEWTNATYNRYKAAISKAYKLGVEDGKIQTNPARLVPQKKESAGRIRFLTAEEETKLRAALASRPWAEQQFDVALHTGMRKGEQFSVTLDQVDLRNKYIHLNETKNGSSRYVHLNSEAMRVLTELKHQHQFLKLSPESTLFTSRKKQPMSNPREWFRSVCEEAGIEGVTWHTLRHTFASRLVMAGVDLKTVQELMGHKTIAMTARYAHLSPLHKLKALETLVPPVASPENPASQVA